MSDLTSEEFPEYITMYTEDLETLIQLVKLYYLREHRSEATFPRTRQDYRDREAIIKRLDEMLYGTRTYKQGYQRTDRWRRTGSTRFIGETIIKGAVGGLKP